MNRLPKKPNETPVTLFNPSLDVFEFPYEGIIYILSSYGIETYPKYLADKMASRLADKIIGKRGVVKHYQLDKEELLKEIYVTNE